VFGLIFKRGEEGSKIPPKVIFCSPPNWGDLERRGEDFIRGRWGYFIQVVRFPMYFVEAYDCLKHSITFHAMLIQQVIQSNTFEQ
jgi:hypothetical protein